MILLITGERDWTDRQQVERWIEKTAERYSAKIGAEGHAGLHLVLGDCKIFEDGQPEIGVDWFAWQWASRVGCSYFRHIAEWKRLGRYAGPTRNQAMVVEVVTSTDPIKRGLAFWSGRRANSGTLDCFSQATIAHIPVQIVPRRKANR